MFHILKSIFKKKKPKAAIPEAPAYFDAVYYDALYPEVSQAGMQAWWHFYHHGYSEGRWPCSLRSSSVEPLLWGAEQQIAKEQLHALLNDENEAERSSAAWFLSRWYAAKSDWEQVLKILPVYIQSEKPIPGLMGPKLLWLEALRHSDIAQADAYLKELELHYGDRVDLSLMKMNLGQARKAALNYQPLNSHYQQVGLSEVSVQTNAYSYFDGLQGASSDVAVKPEKASSDSELVSVIVPAYNAEKTIETAISSLLSQTWSQLEILVVDDASNDGTVTVVKKLAQKDSRIQLIQQEKNQGAYATRNLGLAKSRGEFITVHDSDDWSHPQKIEQQVHALLKNPELKGSLSHWVRASEVLSFGSWESPEDWNGLVHRNVSSLMIRRQVFNELGFWDAVVCSADTEYYYRIIAAYGAQALYEVHQGLPLAFGRVRSESLTQSAETHIFSIFNGLRQRYREAYEAWHSSHKHVANLYLPQFPESRPFEVDSEMLRSNVH